MKEILLANGRGIALVDDVDWPVAAQYGWHLYRAKHISYAGTNIKDAYGKWHSLPLHRLILDPHGVEAAISTGRFRYANLIDHENRNGLDCRRQNLRTATHSENAANSKVRNGKKFKGIHRHGRGWRAKIVVEYKPILLGVYDSQEEAAKAYDAAALKHFGEFARVNFPSAA